MKIKITIDNSKKRLDKFLTEKLENLSRSQIQKQIKNNLIFVNGKQVPVHYFLKENDVIEIQTNKRKKEKDKGSSLVKKIKVIDETNEYLVVEKPSGLLTHPDNIHNETTLLDWVIQKYPEIKNIKAEKNRPGIVHRLDRDTSGILIFAKNENAKRYLQENWKKFNKKYVTVVHGKLQDNEGILTSYLVENKIYRMYSVKDPNKGKYSKTGYKVIKESQRFSLLEINFFTGRKHQIRVHLSEKGHPVVGDKIYGADKVTKRLALHAISLKILHPSTHEKMSFETKIPLFLKSLVKL